MRHKLAMIADGAMDRTQLKKLVLAQDEFVEKVRNAPTSPRCSHRRRGRAHRLARRPRRHRRLGPRPGLRRRRARASTTSRPSTPRARTAPGGRAALAGLHGGDREAAGEIIDSTQRISTLVDAAKQYSQMDRAPHQWVDLHEGLVATLVMLGRSSAASRWSRSSTGRCPRIPAYPAELNQVWTNLIDNARDAMDGAGTLTIRTAATTTARWSRSGTPARASRPRSGSGSSSRSSPPSRSARAPGWASTSPTGSW